MLAREKILVVEDEQEIQDLIVMQLQRDGYAVQALGSGEEAVNYLAKEKFDLVVLDWMLPGVSGLELVRIIRHKSSQPSLPILMVTARVESGDIISGLEAGADDYVTKPFDSSVLLARVRSLLRRSRVLGADQKPLNVLSSGGVKVDLEAHEVTCDGDRIHLTPSEFKLLSTLLMHSGKVFTRESLIAEVQGEGVSVVDRAIDTHVFGLRKKLGMCGDVIETVRGIGYRVKAPNA